MSRSTRLLLLLPVLISLGIACSARGPGSLRVPGDGLRASCKGRLSLGEETIRFRGDVALSPPDGIRVEMRGPVGGTRALFAQHAGRLKVLIPGRKEFIDEEADAKTIESLLGVRVDARGLFELVSSADPRRCGKSENGPNLMLTCRDGKLLAEFEGGSLELRLEKIERRVAVPEELFEPVAPDGWRRLFLDDGVGPAFFLR